MTNASLLSHLARTFSPALPDGLTLEVDGAGYILRGGEGVAAYHHPEELPPELLTTLFLDSVQAAVADFHSDYWPCIGGLHLRYEVHAATPLPLIHFSPV